MPKTNKQPKLDLFKRTIPTKKTIKYSSGGLRKGDSVEVLKPSNVKNLYQTGTLIRPMPRPHEPSQLWEIRMASGEVDYCEENFLIRATTPQKE